MPVLVWIRWRARGFLRRSAGNVWSFGIVAGCDGSKEQVAILGLQAACVDVSVLWSIQTYYGYRIPFSRTFKK